MNLRLTERRKDVIRYIDSILLVNEGLSTHGQAVRKPMNDRIVQTRDSRNKRRFSTLQIIDEGFESDEIFQAPQKRKYAGHNRWLLSNRKFCLRTKSITFLPSIAECDEYNPSSPHWVWLALKFTVSSDNGVKGLFPGIFIIQQIYLPLSHSSIFILIRIYYGIYECLAVLHGTRDDGIFRLCCVRHTFDYMSGF